MPADLIALGLMAATAKADLAGSSRRDARTTVGVPAAGGPPPSHELRLHVPADPDGDPSHAPSALKPKRLGSMIDYVMGESGLRLSAGLRSQGRKKLAKGLNTGATIYAPAQRGTLAYRANYKRQEPAITLGWTLPVAAGAVLGVEAGTALSDNNGRATSASIAQPRLSSGSWSKLSAVAQIALAFKL